MKGMISVSTELRLTEHRFVAMCSQATGLLHHHMPHATTGLGHDWLALGHWAEPQRPGALSVVRGGAAVRAAVLRPACCRRGWGADGARAHVCMVRSCSLHLYRGEW